MFRKTIEVDLDDFSTQDLIDAIHERSRDKDLQDMDCKGIINALKILTCPPEIISQIEEWARQPVPTRTKLDAWLEAQAETEGEG